ncbi:MAG: ppx-GppA [Actinobacteria bacterium]|nr:ppx-GppA [Actinomycetota bacterium]
MACDLLNFSDPPEPWQVSNIRLYFSERIRAGTAGWGKRGFKRMVGTAGTFTTLAALDLRMTKYRPERIDGYSMSLGRVKHWEDRLGRLGEKERLRLPGMEKGREKYIVPGVCQAVAAMEHFGTEKLVVSDAGLLEGILMGIPAGKGDKR